MAKSKSKPKPKSAAKPQPGAPDAQTLARIADALERLAPRPNSNSDFDSADAFIWQAQGSRLVPVPRRQLMVVVMGSVETTASDGETRLFTPGSAILLEDTTGRGHSSRTVDGEVLIAVTQLGD